MKFAMLTLHFAPLAVLVISDLTFLIALVVPRPCQIAMCRLHFAISTDQISLNSFHGFACIGSVDLVIIGPLKGWPSLHLLLFILIAIP